MTKYRFRTNTIYWIFRKCGELKALYNSQKQISLDKKKKGTPITFMSPHRICLERKVSNIKYMLITITIIIVREKGQRKKYP